MINNSLQTNRRNFLKLTGLSAISLLAGCAGIEYSRNPSFNYYRDSKRIIVDAHCHLMNQHDGSLDFVDRHVLEASKAGPIERVVVDFLARAAALINYGNAMTAKDEVKWIKDKKILTGLQSSPRAFYEIADKSQEKFFSAPEYHQTTGFFSNRTRNAARMLLQFPQVDIFTPATVDFYEGACSTYSRPEDLAEYYRLLNIASMGRFLPLISFHPERQLDFDHPNGEPTTGCTSISPLNLVKKAIEEMGFVGVKLHPTAGYSPYENGKNGCENTKDAYDWPLKNDPAKARYYDKYLNELFAYCRDNDVPILTHSGTSIPANRACMERKEDHLDWTNSPKQWVQAMDAIDCEGDGFKRLRVCLAHFANGFDKDKNPDVWLTYAVQAMKSHSNLYIDMSAMSEWFNSKNEIDIEYGKVIKEFIINEPVLKKQLMYGSDWHMPGTALIGSSYFTELDDLISSLPNNAINQKDTYSSNIMGANAVEFYGLAQGRATRQRLENFYTKNNIDLDRIVWMKKLAS